MVTPTAPPHPAVLAAERPRPADAEPGTPPLWDAILPSGRPLSARGRDCHALVVPLPAPVDAAALRRRLADTAPSPVDGGAGEGIRLWETAVPAPAEGAVARERLHREALRPVRAGLSPVRATLLSHTDGTAHLVLVAERSAVPATALRRLADVATGRARPPADGRTGAARGAGRADGTAAGTGVAPGAAATAVGESTGAATVVPSLAGTAPGGRRPHVDWGLGDPGRHGVAGARALALPRGALDSDLLLAAVALTLTRYTGEPEAEVGLLDTRRDGDGLAVLRIGPVDEDAGAPALSAAARAARAARAADVEALPAVGVVVATAAEEAGAHLPALAPVFPLALHCAQGPDGTVRASAWYDEGVFAPEVVEHFCAAVERAAGQLATDDDRPLTTLPLLAPSEAAEVLRLGGLGTPVPAGGERPGTDGRARPAAPRIDRRFEEVARRSPDSVAVTDGTTTLTYRQLRDRADAIAAGLWARGVSPGSLVGVCLDRGTPLVAALLGILRAGCAYVPMDFRYPQDRLRYTVEDAGVPIVIGDPGHLPAVPGVQVADVEDLARTPLPPSPRAAPTSGADGVDGASGADGADGADDAAYVIYTSGSTGRPKGVVIPHRNVTALLDATSADFALGPDDVWTLFHSTAFDFSVWEMWGCLLTGGRLVVVPYWTTRDTEEFHRLLAEERVTVLNQTPSAFTPLVRTDRSAGRDLAVRLLIFGGEPLDVRVLGPWFARHSPALCRVVNMFGITETTVHVTAQSVTPAELAAGSRSVGHALPGWSLSVRDARGRLLPPGAAGEIHVGGAGLAHGYLGRAELTAQRFVTDPVTGERLYRSGDKGRLHPDGRLDHLGRLDNQVKVRGHRIELDEIRSVLAATPGVDAALVVVAQDPPGEPAGGPAGGPAGDPGGGPAGGGPAGGGPGGARIDAYVVLAEEHDNATAPRGLLDEARRILPEYMVPSTLTVLPAIPLTANGKPDVARLPAPAAAGAAGAAARASGVGSGSARNPADDPTTGAPGADSPGQGGGVAKVVLEVWSACLRREVTPEDNFFELGGNSLLVVHALGALRERGLPRVTVRDFYTHSTAALFVTFVEGLVGGTDDAARPGVPA